MNKNYYMPEVNDICILKRTIPFDNGGVAWEGITVLVKSVDNNTITVYADMDTDDTINCYAEDLIKTGRC